MSNEFDAFMQELQERVFEEIKRDFGEKVYRRWRNPLYMGVIHDADGWAKIQGTCGDNMEIFLKFGSGRVVKASFQTDGCGATVVCGSYAAEMAIGKTPDDLFEITGETILTDLGGFPPDHRHCAFLAAEALQAAADDYMIKQTGRPETDTLGKEE